MLVCMDQYVWNQAGHSLHPAGTDVLLPCTCPLVGRNECHIYKPSCLASNLPFDVSVSDTVTFSSTFPSSSAVNGSCERLPGLTSQTVLRLLFSFLRHQGQLCLLNCIYRSYRSVLLDPYFLKKCLHTLTVSLSVQFMDLKTLV